MKKAKEVFINYLSKVGFITKRQLHPDLEKAFNKALKKYQKKLNQQTSKRLTKLELENRELKLN